MLLRIRHALHVVIVIIDPYERDIIGHLKTVLIDGHRLLVWHKYLGDGCGGLAYMLLEQLALLFHHLRNQWHAFLHRQMASQPLIVQATHGGGIDILIARSLSETIVPLLQNRRAVGLVVPFTITALIPLRQGGIIQQ